MSNLLKRINQEAKRIQKAKKISYREAQRQAGKKFRTGARVGATKKPAARARSRKRTAVKISKEFPVRVPGVVTIGHRMAGLSKDLERTRDKVHDQLGWLLAAQRTAKTKKEKRGLQPRINELTRILRSLEGGK